VPEGEIEGGRHAHEGGVLKGHGEGEEGADRSAEESSRKD